MALVATFLCVAAIAALFALDRDRQARTSPALWIPTLWLLINGSRGVSQWLQRPSAVSLQQQYTEGNPLDAAVFGILILAGIVVLNFRRRRLRELLQQNLPILLFFAYAGLSILWSAYSFIALKRWSKAMGDLVMVLVVLTDPQPLNAVKRFFARATFILLPLSVLLIEFYPGLGSMYDPTDQTMIYTGVTTFKNLLGMITMVCGLAALWRFLEANEDRSMWHRRRHLLAHGAMIATAVWLLVKCNSMTSLSCFGLAGAVMVMATRGWVKRRPGRVHLLVGTAIAIPLFALFVDTVGTLLHALGRNPTLTDRTSIWRAVLAMHTNPLVGTGFESFWLGSHLQSVWDLSVRGIQEAHNGYLEVYINLGWIGELLLLALIFTGYRHILSALRLDPDWGRLRLAYFTATLIYCLTEAGFRMMNPIWIAFLLVIMSTASRGQMKLQRIMAPLPAMQKPTREAQKVLQ